MLDRQTVGRLHQFANPPVIFVYMNVFVPFYHDHRFGVVDMRHGRLRHNAEHQHAKGNGEQQKQKGDGFMTEDPFNPPVVPSECPTVDAFLHAHEEITGRQLPKTYAVDDFIQHRQEHNAREVRYKQADADGKGLREEDSARDAAHKYKRHEYGDGGERRTENGGDYFVRAAYTGFFEGGTLHTVLADNIGYDNRTVDHHTQSEDKSG